jgi:hypothetical protein
MSIFISYIALSSCVEYVLYLFLQKEHKASLLCETGTFQHLSTLHKELVICTKSNRKNNLVNFIYAILVMLAVASLDYAVVNG